MNQDLECMYGQSCELSNVEKKKKRNEKRSTEQRSDSTIKFNFLNWCKAIDLEVVNA